MISLDIPWIQLCTMDVGMLRQRHIQKIQCLKGFEWVTNTVPEGVLQLSGKMKDPCLAYMKMPPYSQFCTRARGESGILFQIPFQKPSPISRRSLGSEQLRTTARPMGTSSSQSGRVQRKFHRSPAPGLPKLCLLPP